MVWPTVRTRVWPRVCSVWPLAWKTAWRVVWPTVWPRVCSVCPMVWKTSGQSGQWWPKSVQSGQWWTKSVWSAQYLSLGMVGLANACLGYGRSGQYLFWVADFILGLLGHAKMFKLLTLSSSESPKRNSYCVSFVFDPAQGLFTKRSHNDCLICCKKVATNITEGRLPVVRMKYMDRHLNLNVLALSTQEIKF